MHKYQQYPSHDTWCETPNIQKYTNPCINLYICTCTQYKVDTNIHIYTQIPAMPEP